MRHTASLEHLRPVLLHGEAVYLRANSIRYALKALLGAPYSNLLAVPRIPDSGTGEGDWILPTGRQVTPLPELNDTQRQALLEVLRQRVERVMSLIVELEDSADQSRRTLAKLLSRALDVPSESCVYSVDGSPTLVCWAFFDDCVPSGHGYRLIKSFVNESFVPQAVPVPQDFDASALAKAAETSEAEGLPKAGVATLRSARPTTSSWWRRRQPWLILAALAGLAGLASGLWHYLNPLPAIDAGISEPTVSERIEGVSRQRVAGRLLVSVLPGRGLADVEAVLRAAGQWQHVKSMALEPALGTIQLKLDEAHYETIRGTLSVTPWVTGMMPEFILGTSVIPDDPVLRRGGAPSWPWTALNAMAAWDASQGSDTTLIAVVDSGFDTTHPEFEGKHVYTWNAVNGKLEVEGPRDVMVHGTHVAALAAGRADNQQGSAGTCPKCSLLLIRIADDKGRISSSAVLLALRHAVQWRASVVNLSFGARFEPPPEGLTREAAERFIAATQDEARFWSAVLQEFRRQGIVVVQAAGNQGVDALIDPMKRNTASLIVGSTGPGHQLSAFSNYGSAVTLTAPGEGVFSAAPGRGFREFDGTSMASPLVAGAVGLMRSVDPRASFDDIRTALARSGSAVRAAGGRAVGPDVDMAAALALLSARTSGAVGPNPAASQPSAAQAPSSCDGPVRPVRRDAGQPRGVRTSSP